MSFLKPGTLCVIIGGCPENIGLIVEVIKHLGLYDDCEDAYFIKTVSGRHFAQLWDSENTLERGNTFSCITDRHKLRPLIDTNEKSDLREKKAELENVTKSVVQ